MNASARNRGTTMKRMFEMPITPRASSSSRTLRAPRSAVMAVPQTAATIRPVATGANSRTLASTMKPPMRRGELEKVACPEGHDRPPAEAGQEEGHEAGAQDEPALLQELGQVEGPPEDAADGRGEEDRLTPQRHQALAGAASH